MLHLCLKMRLNLSSVQESELEEISLITPSDPESPMSSAYKLKRRSAKRFKVLLEIVLLEIFKAHTTH
jgi:hypothetical protein